MSALIRWFDPNASYHAAVKSMGAEAQARKGKAPPPVWLQYLVFSLGVFASPLIRHYRTEGVWPDLTSWSLVGAAVFSLLTGFIVFPRVVDSLAKSDATAFARLSTVFTAGIGWEQFSGLPAALAA